MGRRRDTSLTVALCVSLLAHGGVAWTFLEEQVLEARRHIAQPPLDRTALAVGPILIQQPDSTKPAPLPKRSTEPEKVTPPVERQEALPKLPPLPPPKPEPPMLKSLFGEPDGRGEAGHSSPGDQPMRAKKSTPEEQAFLSRDPAGAGKIGDPPVKSTAPPGEAGAGKPGPVRKATPEVPSVPALPKPSLLAVAPQPQALPRVQEGKPEERREKVREITEHLTPNIPFGVPSQKVEEVLPKRARRIPDGPPMVAIANPTTPQPRDGSDTAHDASNVVAKEPKPQVQASPAPKPVGAPPTPEQLTKPTLIPPVLTQVAPPQRQFVHQAESGGRPGQRSPSADPAPESDSESDPFSKVVNVDFRDGRLEAQTGRRIKTVRPKLLLSAQYEIFTQDNPRVLLSAKVDATGHVTKVDIYQSSGTPDLDQPCLVALYDWWFEPPKDKTGKPLPDVVVVAITFRTK